MQKIIIANFKSNHTRKSTQEYLKELDKKDFSAKVYVLPTSASLCDNNYNKIQIGAQNAYPTINGAFSGEIGLEALREFDIKTILIGHSERRTLLGENQEFCAKKFDFFSKEGFEIIYCIGEDLVQRKEGFKKVEEFIESQFKGIDVNYKNLIIAYEPIWAIGTGISAELEQIKETHQMIKEKSSAPLLYGGSVNAKNAKEILELKEVDGVLVGSAGLEVKNFYEIISQINKGF